MYQSTNSELRKAARLAAAQAGKARIKLHVRRPVDP
jgi:hypothetical protein